MSKKSDDDRMQQLQELALETVSLQARRAMSPEEERLLADNLVDLLFGRGLPEDRDDISNAAAAASATPLDDLVAQIMAGDPDANEAEIRAALLEASAVTPLRSQELKGLPDTYPFGL